MIKCKSSKLIGTMFTTLHKANIIKTLSHTSKKDDGLGFLLHLGY